MAYFDGIKTQDYQRTIGTGSSDPLPLNFYELMITRNIMKQNSERAKDPQGKYIEVEFDVVSPHEFNRRKYWEKFNIINKSQDAIRIGKEHFSDLLEAVGITELPAKDLAESNPLPELNGKSVCGYLVIEKGSNGFRDSNKCLKYLPIGSTQADYEAWYASKKGSEGAADKKGWGAQPAQPVTTETAGKKPSPWSAKK